MAAPIDDGALLDAVRNVRWPARRIAPGGAAGAHRSRVLGASAEFTERRPYRQGDDPRRVDWKLLARSDRVSIRLANDRAVMTTMLLVDASASMAFPADSLEKWRYARRLAVGLAAAAHGGGDPVGLMVASREGPRRLPPRARRGAVHDLSRVLGETVPAGTTPLAPLLARLSAMPRVAIVSDFLGDADALLALAAACVAAGREIHAVHVVHAAELDPPRATRVVTDPRAPALTRTLGDTTRAGYLHAFAEWRESIARAWRLSGAYYTLAATDEPVAHAVRRVAAPPAGAR